MLVGGFWLPVADIIWHTKICLDFCAIIYFVAYISVSLLISEVGGYFMVKHKKYFL